MTGRYYFHRCLSAHTWWGGGGGVALLHPIILPLVLCPFRGGTPQARSMVGWGTHQPSQDGCTPGWGGGVPSILEWGNLPHLGWGIPPPGMGYPPPPPPLGQQRELQRGGRYASCVHAGGLSYYSLVSALPMQIQFYHELPSQHSFFTFSFHKC